WRAAHRQRPIRRSRRAGRRGQAADDPAARSGLTSTSEGTSPGRPRGTVGAMPSRTVALVTLGCTRNEVDSEELAGRLELSGWTLVEDAADADVAVVNTCGFVEQA